MDINTRLDGFIVHPLDAFNDHHHEDNIPKFSSTAPHLDGFQVHPLDSFLSHEHQNNTTNNYLNLDDTNQINNYFPTNETITADSLLYQNNNTDSTIYQPSSIQDLISNSNYNNDFNYNQYEKTNYSTSEYPITYTEPTPITTTTTSTSNYNYISTPSYNTISYSPQNNYINTSTTYETYPSTTNFNYSKILPTKYLPAIKAQNNINSTSAPTIKLVPKVTNKVTYTTSSVIAPSKSVYSVPSYPTYSILSFTPPIKTSYFGSQILPISTTSYNYKVTTNTIKPTVLVKRPYRVVTFKPQVRWNNVIHRRQKIIIPKVKRYIIPRRTSVIVPRKKSVIIQNPVVIQPQKTISVSTHIPSIIQPNPIISTPAPSNVIVPTITIGTPNPIQKIEKFPSDNFAGRSRIINNNIMGFNKVYYPRDFDRKKGRKF